MRSFSIAIAAVAALVLGSGPLRAQLINQLDCYYDARFDRLRCPEMPEAAGSATNGEANAPFVTGRASTTTPEERASAPLCTSFKTYDARTGTYRGFDGRSHECRPQAQAGEKKAASE